MPGATPYESSDDDSPPSVVTTSRLLARWTVLGFVIGGTIPVFYGIYGLYRESVYLSSLPPGTAACGMGTLGAMASILIGGPFCGTIGSGIGLVAFKLLR
jgi:hypothetical protein